MSSGYRALLALCAMAFTVPGASDASSGETAPDVTFVDASLEPPGQLLGSLFTDIDGDGRDEVCLAVRSRSGERQLRLHRIHDASIPAEPYLTIPVLEDVLAYGFADVRSEPGRELFFLVRSGVWSYSTTLDGYRDNAELLAETELIFDVAAPRDLPAWSYVVPFSEVSGAQGGEGGGPFDGLLLPGREGFALWTRAGADSTYRPQPGWQAARASDAARAEALAASTAPEGERRSGGSSAGGSMSFGPGGVRVSIQDSSWPAPFLEEEGPETSTLLERSKSYSGPALADVDGDGALDLVQKNGEELQLFLSDGAGLPSEPTRIETLASARVSEPEEDESWSSLRLVDLDGDGDLDALARFDLEGEGLENEEITLSLFVNDGQRLLPEKPQQILRFEAAELRARVADVDGDGRPDLIVRKFELPSFLDSMTGLEFRLTHLVYLGESGARPFARKPALKQVQTFDENTIRGAIANRQMTLDCDGDGIADMVEVDLNGRVAIRRLRRDTGFFGGESWELDEAPWRRFEVFGSIEALSVRDLNGDGLGDIVSESDEALTILLSTGGPN